VVERHDRSRVITLFWPSFQRGAVRLHGAAAQHARVRRVERGDPIRLVNGVGDVAAGNAIRAGKDDLTVEIEDIEQIARPAALEVMVPIADKDRMLMAAEKCVELQVTTWTPTLYSRSRSVSPRGEGGKFQDKVRARMQSALEQSGGAWLPTILDECEVEHALIPGDGTRVLLDASGEFMDPDEWRHVSALAVGPEGGTEDDELALARERGWRITSLGPSTLRFETAMIAGIALIRALQLSPRME
jgi:16S rRNA (uracil1498-N3)-methyltransferase